MSYGVMGGPMQAQGHVQMLSRIQDYGQNPQTASDAPRWQVLDGFEVAIEPGLKPEVYEQLSAMGHQISRQELDVRFAMGGAQLVYRLEHGYLAASDHRKDGQAVGF